MGSVISKTANFITGASETPTYNQQASQNAQIQAAQAQAKYGNYGVNSTLGGVGLIQNPDGTYTKQYTDSSADVMRNQLINQGLSGISLDPTQAQDAYYSQATRLLTPQFEQQAEGLEQSLADRGIMAGSEQYNTMTENLQNQQAGTLSDIANQAVFSGQDLLGSQINNLSGLSSQRDIGLLSGLSSPTGASFTSTYDPYYSSKAQGVSTQNQRNQLFMTGLGQAFSDIRLKENLIEIGELDNGLSVYIGNYNDKAIELDSTLNKEPQLFLVAQEVQEIRPKAVTELENGYLVVNYKEAVK